MNLHFHSPKTKLKKGFVSLYQNRIIIFVATGLLGIFMPIFLYDLFDENIQKVVLFYLIGSLGYFLFLPISTRFLNKFGFRKALQTATFFGSLYYVILFYINDQNYKIFIPLLVFSLLIFRLLYWIPYHVDFAKFSHPKNRGSELSLLSITKNFIAIFTPALAGLIVTKGSFNLLFIIAAILYLLSIIPLLKISHTREKFTWSIKETWQNFFSKKRRLSVLSFIADGSENIIGTIIWPIFIIEILNGNYLELGVISSSIVGITIVLQFFVGNLTDKSINIKEKLLNYGSSFYAIGWILKIFIATAFHIFIIDAYHRLSRIFMRTSFDVMIYDKASDEGHFIDEFTVIKEMAIHLGIVLTLVLIYFISPFIGLKLLFIFGAIASILLNFFRFKIV